ncbi:F-box protein CPR1-like isoform X1 [Arachis hypogaea]|uniref:F-box protein CPR1-like isoform X1 n=1 Tax=Arachis hypogaea TaxID=3818 RepID=UPI0010FC4BE7|nr:F-box protein CPR1-like isoform X1 [Arachis hypogaea]XP_029153890.1 F-box protein CPR1-like isoform X1 [Arachis hypogaea]QHO09552.1 F-box protein [Arachis hypogaea]
MEKKQKSIDNLPHDLIHRIFLRVPAKHLAPLRCVSKLWYSLISDPQFAELHFQYSPAATDVFIFIKGRTVAFLEPLFSDNNDASLQVKKVWSPFKKEQSASDFEVLGSCKSFVLLHRNPHFFVVWNPLTGSSKRISYSCIVSRCKHKDIRLPCKFHLYGLGYDASQDDYLLVVAWQDKDDHYHLDYFSLRTNSWINLDAALFKLLGVFDCNSCGVFLNGAIHWVPYPLTAYRDAIIIFDMKERTFSRISGPEKLVMSSCSYSSLALLGGCLALYYNDSYNTHIWVMKEYKVHSSWTLYKISTFGQPLCLSSNGDIIGRYYDERGNGRGRGYFKYNVRRYLPKHFESFICPLPTSTVTVYTESLLPLPTDNKDKDNRNFKKKKQLKHTVNKAKEQSSMEKRNQNDKSKTIHDILPLDLIHIILLRVPIRHLARLRCVSKLWYSLISDPDFAELHFCHSLPATKACFFMKNDTMAYLVYLDDNDASQRMVCPPFKKKPPSDFEVLGSCRGFILLHRYPHFLVVWNPLTGVSKRISYSHIVSRPKYHSFRLPYSTHLHGFGYDAS